MPTTTFKTCSYCSKEVDKEKMDEHRSSCGVEEVECGNGCGQKMPRYIHEHHMEESCQKRNVQCHYCSAMILFNEVQDHKQRCSMEIVECNVIGSFQGERFSASNRMTENCPYCTQAVRKCEMDEHVEKCEDTMSCCDECGKKVQKQHMDVHLKEYCSKRVKECEYCGTSVVVSTLLEHYKVCELLQANQSECSKCMISCNECLSEHLDEKDSASSTTCNKEQHKKSEISCDRCPKQVKSDNMGTRKEKCMMNEVQCVFCDSFVPNDSLAEHYGTCESAIVRCGYKCGVKIQRKDFSEHYRNECPKALVACEHCDKKFERQLLGDHQAACVKFPIPCPESCGVEVSREDVERHLDEECQKRFAACAYKKMQCSYEGCSARMTQHMKEDVRLHLDLVKSMVENLQFKLETERRRYERLQMEIHVLRHGSFLWKVKNIAENIEKANEDKGFMIWSPPFYSSKHGYKLRVWINPDERRSQYKGYLGVYIQVMPGEYDSILQWPFRERVKFKLVDQAMSGEDIVKSFRGKDGECHIKPKDGKCNCPSGIPKFVSHIVLNSRSYIADNAIFLEVSVK